MYRATGGITPGCGHVQGFHHHALAGKGRITMVTFLRAIPVIQAAKSKVKGDEKIGYDILSGALKAPTRQIVDNGGRHGEVIVEELLEKTGNTGYDAGKGEYVDMLKAGIIDPAKVSRVALQNAASVAGLMLTTNVIISDLKDDDAENAATDAVI